MNPKSKRIGLLGVGSVLLAGVLSFAPPGLERYCPLYPSIDTRYADGFSESQFARIQVGMSEVEVARLLGAPLERTTGRQATRWQYTQDGKCSWADWAWLGREVVFVDGRVAEKVARIYYD